MLSSSPSQIRLAAGAALADRWPGLVRDAALPWLWVSGIVAAAVLGFWLTGQVWVPAVVGVAGMVLVAWWSARLLAAAHGAVESAERERVALEQALQVSQKMEMLGRLTVGAVHDFNNHLTVISSNVEMVARRLDGRQERLLRHTEAAMQGVQRAAMLAGRLLAFSRQSDPEPEAVDADRLLNSLSDLLRRALGDHVSLAIVRPDQPWFTWADVNQMENALLSLAVNARDQIRSGGTLVIAVSNVRLDTVFAAAYPLVQPGDYIQIAVSGAAGEPTGWQLAGESDGADLSLARAFVADAGGVLLRSDPATGGSALRLFLPRYSPPALSGAAVRREPGGRATILVVEDDAAVRAACVEVLQEMDYKVLEAADAMEAFRLIADHGGIDLLFTDLGLPGGVSGRALAEAARNVDSDMRVVFTTGYDQVDLPERADTALLRKPFAPAQLGAMVRSVLAAERSVVQPEPVRV